MWPKQRTPQWFLTSRLCFTENRLIWYLSLCHLLFWEAYDSSKCGNERKVLDKKNSSKVCLKFEYLSCKHIFLMKDLIIIERKIKIDTTFSILPDNLLSEIHKLISLFSVLQFIRGNSFPNCSVSINVVFFVSSVLE